MLKELTANEVEEIAALSDRRVKAEDTGEEWLDLTSERGKEEMERMLKSGRPEFKEILDRVGQLSHEGKAELAALMMLGRGEGEGADFESLVDYGRGIANDPTCDIYLTSKTPLGRYLRDGLRKINL